MKDLLRVLCTAMVAAGLTAVPRGPAVHGEVAPAQRLTIAFGGDISLGLEINAYAEADEGHVLDDVDVLKTADVTIANLEGVIASVGDAGAAKSDALPNYFRGRPETIGILQSAGIDVVGTANNHVGDYGDAALLEQSGLLDQAGIAHAGSGANWAEACAPAMLDVRGVRIAIFSVGSTEPMFAAGEDEPGTCYLGLDDRTGWESTASAAIADARQAAHLVFVAWHAGKNFVDEPSAREIELGRRLVDWGADAVLGSSAHVLQGLEIYKGRPIIHDAGNLLTHFDRPYDAAVYVLTVTPSGLERIEAVPVISDHGHTRLASDHDRDRIVGFLQDASAKLGTRLPDGTAELTPPTRSRALAIGPPSSPPAAPAIPESTSPPSQCTVEAVPADARVDDVGLGGGLTLVGARVMPDQMVTPQLLWVETYWRVEQPTAGDIFIAVLGTEGRNASATWVNRHQGCDWAWPVSRWEPGTVYRDYVPLRPVDAVSLVDSARFVTLSAPLGVAISVIGPGVDGAHDLAEVHLGLPVGARAGAALATVVALVLSGLWLRRRLGSAR